MTTKKTGKKKIVKKKTPAPAPRGKSSARRATPPKAAPKPAPRPPASEKEPKAAPAARSARSAPATRPAAGRVALPAGPARLGHKFTCFKCGAKFYDLNRPAPICPKCGANQTERPRPEPRSKGSPAPARRPPKAMPPLLDEDDEAVVVDEDEAVVLDLVEGPDLLEDADLDEEDLGDDAGDADEEEEEELG